MDHSPVTHSRFCSDIGEAISLIVQVGAAWRGLNLAVALSLLRSTMGP